MSIAPEKYRKLTRFILCWLFIAIFYFIWVSRSVASLSLDIKPKIHSTLSSATFLLPPLPKLSQSLGGIPPSVLQRLELQSEPMRSGSETARAFRLMYGTAWKKEQTAPLVQQAIAAGFRAIDTANMHHYFEAGVGDGIARAVAAGTISSPSELFIQTKFTHASSHDPTKGPLPFHPSLQVAEQVVASFQSSLQHLRVNSIDSYVLHGPQSYSNNMLGHADYEAYETMESLVRARRVRFLGVSNVSAQQLTQLIAWIAKRKGIMPTFVQNRCLESRRLEPDVRSICAQHNITYQGFSLLTGNPATVHSVAVAQAAAARRCHPTDIVMRWGLDVGMVVLTGSKNHMEQDLRVVDLPRLTADEIAAISGSSIGSQQFGFTDPTLP